MLTGNKFDLMDKLGSKSKREGAVNKTAPSAGETNVVETNPNTLSGKDRGTNLLQSAASKSEPAATVKTNTVDSDLISSPVMEEPTGNGIDSTNASATSANSADWTPENMMKEIKKLREENKATRLKYAETVEKLKTDTDVKVSAKEQELQELVSKARELDEFKAKEEDRKRDLSERVAHRESKIAQLEAELQASRKIADESLRTLNAQVEQYKADVEVQLEVHKQRLKTELSGIPEKFKSIAEYIVKGAGDPRDALVALTEAKLNGLFEDKKVVVSHSVPGANDGARSSKERMETAVQGMRGKLDSASKIREGLKAIRAGETNTAFRNR